MRRSPKLCAERIDEVDYEKFNCTDLFKNYYCETKFCRDNKELCAKDGRVPYNYWSQTWSMVVTMTVVYIIVFFILFLAHNLWSKNIEGYKGPKDKDPKKVSLNESEKNESSRNILNKNK